MWSRQASVGISRRRRAATAAVAAAVAFLAPSWAAPAAGQSERAGAEEARAEHVDLEITRREVVADGHRFGAAGAYEKLVGTVALEIDPRDPHNAGVVDLAKAPRNERGLVEYDTDFYLLRPVDMGRWNGKLFFEVNNRGNKLALAALHDAARLNDPSSLGDFGTGFLLERGYALAWTGWEGDVLPGEDRMTIRLPVPTKRNGDPVTQKIVVEFHDRYFDPDGKTDCLPLSGSPAFASYPAVLDQADEAELRVRPSDSPRPPGPTVPEGSVVDSEEWEFSSATEICVDDGFRPGNVYELYYTAQDPRVMGLGYTATRDVVSFLRHADEDSNGDENPLAVDERVRHVLGQGISSSGMYMRDFLYQGFNEDIEGRRVFDGVNIHIPGAHKLFLNYRFAQPNPFSTQHRDRYMPYAQFPFNYGVRTDPVSGREDGILKRPETDPLVIHTDTSTEYWQFQAALVNTDGFGNDVALPANARQYLISGTQHFATAGQAPTRGLCQQLTNPTHAGPVLRALFVDLDQWVGNGVVPPASRAPTVADGTLVSADQESTGFPNIPGVTYNGFYNDAGERDFGPRVRGNRGIIDDWRHADVLRDYTVLVPHVDRVGIDLGGVELPEVGVPAATLTGWNLRRAPYTEGDLCSLNGMYLPLPWSPRQAELTGDPRPSLIELYGDFGDYIKALHEHAQQLVADRLLLPEDARAAVREASDRADNDNQR